MQELIIQIMDQFGYLGVCFLVAVENIFPPIPSEVILTFGGFMTTYTRLTYFQLWVQRLGHWCSTGQEPPSVRRGWTH